MSAQPTGKSPSGKANAPAKDKTPKTRAAQKQSRADKKPAAKQEPEKSGPKISVLIVDDHPLFRSGLRGVLELDDAIEVIGEAQDGQQALEMAHALEPQVILMDVNLPLVNGLQATRELTAHRQNTAVIILTAYHDDEQMLHAVRAGAYGYFPKEVAPSELLNAIRTVSSGNYAINDQVLAKPQVASWLISQFETIQTGAEDAPEESFRSLSAREMEILRLITKGLSNKEIAKALGISRQTVKNHMTSILRKLAVNDRTQAAVYALRRGWIRLQDTK